MINANDYRSFTDSETLENALCNLRPDGILVIPPRESDIDPERDWWLIDRAILIPENTSVALLLFRGKDLISMLHLYSLRFPFTMGQSERIIPPR